MLIPFIWGKKKSVTVDMAVSNFHSALFLTVNDLSGDQIPIFSEISLSSLASRWALQINSVLPAGQRWGSSLPRCRPLFSPRLLRNYYSGCQFYFLMGSAIEPCSPFSSPMMPVKKPYCFESWKS